MSRNVFLFVPNLLGYGRIGILLYSCWYMLTDPWRAMIGYFVSGILDAFDGYAARLLNQSTRFGAMLDMLVDRCATMCLITCLITFYPRYSFWLQLSMILDITSHWLQVHTSTSVGSKSHKSTDGNFILRWYYHNRVLLFFLTDGFELFYVSLYMHKFFHEPLFLQNGPFFWIACLLTPVALIRTFVNLVQLGVAAVNLVRIDSAELAAAKSQ